MFFTTSLLLVSAATSTFAAAIRRATPPAGWWTAGLEPYDTYHARYMDLSCNTMHNTSFFDQCCHPLLASESLSDRPAECDPANECDATDDDTSSSAPAVPSTTSAAPQTTTAAAAAPQNVAPNPQTSAEPKTTSTSAASKPATTSAAPKPATTSAAAPSHAPTSSSNVLASGNGGIATFFFQNGVAGACGAVHDDSKPLVALDFRTFNAAGDCGASSLCGKTIHITNKSTGKSIDALVADCCPTCTSKSSIDLSTGAFDQLASRDQGEFPVEWTITN